MEQLLSRYSLSEIIVFLALIAAALKGFITFFDWAIDRLRKIFSKEVEQDKKEVNLNSKLDSFSAQITELRQEQGNMKKNIESILMGLVMVIDSDKDSIKAYITEKHHYFMEKGSIDYQSLDVLEHRFKHYVDEGGNSFIEDLMKDLRKLPNN